MPQTPERKRAYNKARQAAKRATEVPVAKLTDSARAKVFLQGVPFRNEFGEQVLRRGSYEPGHEHYWGWVSKAEEGTRVCLEFEYQGRNIGGCGQVMAWEGKPLNTYTDGLTDSAELIRDSRVASDIQKKMPVTAKRS